MGGREPEDAEVDEDEPEPEYGDDEDAMKGDKKHAQKEVSMNASAAVK